MCDPNKRKAGDTREPDVPGSEIGDPGSSAGFDTHSDAGGTVIPPADGHGDDATLAEFDRQFRTMFEATVDGIIVVDSRTRRFYTGNLALSRMLGYAPQEIKELTIQDIHPPDAMPFVMQQFEKLVRREQTVARDIPVKRKDGVVFHADITCNPATLAGKSCLIGFFHDISERKRTEDELKDMESRFRSVMEKSSEGIVLTDEAGKIIEWNRALEEITGRARSKVLGRSTWEVLGELIPREERFDQSRELVRQWATHVSQNGQVPQDMRLRELEFVRSDGERHHLQVFLYPIRTSKGFRTGVICRDITDKKAVERALRESEEKYRTLVESAGESIATVDRSGTFLFMNKTAAARLGGTPEDFVGKTMPELFPGPTGDRQAASVRRVIDTGQGMNVLVVTELQGQPRWHNTTVEPIRDAMGKITAALVMARDIHELQQARQELDQYRDKMCRAEQLASLGALSATIAHEMTQPLTVSRLSLEEAMAELEATGASATALESLRECLEGIADATGRIEQFRTFARQSSREAPSEVPLQNVVTRTIRLLDGKAKERRVSLSTLGVSDLPPVRANEKDMEQMCFALIENAIQAADGSKQRSLIVSGRRHDGGITLRFEDTCGGVTTEHLDKIFQPFYTTKPYGEGTGLGLCIVKRVITQAGGSIRVENKPGEGVAFCVTLPLEGPE